MSTYSNLRYIIESMKLAVGKSPFDELVIEAFETILEELKEKQAVPAERAGDACPRCDGERVILVKENSQLVYIICPDCHGKGKRTLDTLESGGR